MAGALVGGAFLSATLQVLLDRMASRTVLDFFKGQKLSAQLLKKLKTKMITINKVLEDADDKQHTDPYVKQWLDELKDIVYEAEDLLDEITSEVQRSKIEAESQTTLEKMQDSASCDNLFKTGKQEKLEEIIGTLEDLVEQKDALRLMDCTAGQLSYQTTPTSSIPDESVIHGRDADKEAIMKWVLSDHPNSSNKVDVLAIVGIGGIGKTTLAQHVYSDSRDCFDKKAWVCVSKEFDVSRVTKDIFEEFSRKSSDSNKFNELQNLLKEASTGQRFLLVLDDVWSKDYNKWNNLLKPLMFGKKGSKILVTSRNQDVADCIKTSPTHQLQKLSDNDCWSLFEKHAFMGTDMPNVHPALETIGRQIVKKCDGLPLAAKLLGGGLRSERNPEKWKKILERDLLDVEKDSILPILRVSYQFLPSHLKRCFAYCAVFPKDYEFKKEKLIRLWMAEGLLPQHKVNEDIEQVGEDCLDGLVSRSFFQKSTVRESFLMHDLINDLAKSICGEFCFRYGADRLCEITGRIRHLWFCDDWEVDKSIFPIQQLRTILFQGWAGKVENWLPTFTCCRVLSLCCNKLPDSIGNLMHLRYLDLSRSSMERLPDTVTSLCNLETLILYWCRFLVELPATIFKLINLSLIDIRGTNLRKMPPHMGKLKKLGELDYYIVGKESDCSLKELGPLKRLRGHLRMQKLRNVSQVQEAKEASLKSKEKLKGLELKWNDEGSEDSLHERNVLEQLQPHTNIEQLSVSGYAGTRFPDWVGDSSFSNMVELNLEGCRYCSSLPALGQLGSLKRLSIIGFDGITVVGPEFYGNSNKPPFGCLESLRFEGMPQWQEWVPYSNMDEGDGATAAFPLLQVLEIRECGQLASFRRAPSLQQLNIMDDSRYLQLCRSTARADEEQSLLVYRWLCPDSPLDLVNSVTTFQDIEIRDCDSITSFPLDIFSLLKRLKIYSCRSLEFLSGAAAAELEHLESLTIRDCPNLKEIQLTHLPSLETIEISDCCSLVRFVLDLAPALEEFAIYSCRNLEFLCGAAAAELEHLKSLKIRDCPQLKEIQLTHLPFLETLEISDCGSLVRFPLDLAPALEELAIYSCGNFQFLSVAAAAELEYLKSLIIRGCANLKEIRLTHLSSLKTLDISDCGSFVRFPLDLAPALKYLEICHCGNLEFLSGAAAAELEHLIIRDCHNLEIQLTQLPSLKTLYISDCGSLVRFQLDLAPALEYLVIQDCPNLKKIQFTHLPSLKDLTIEGCGLLERFLLNWAPALGYLLIQDCPNIKEIQPTRLPSLTKFTINGCNLLERFLLDLAPALEKLEINGCGNLGFLYGAAAAKLKNLKIRDCTNLKEIEPTHLPSLTELYISGCDQLVSLPRAPALQRLTIGHDSHDVALGYRNSSRSPPEMVEQLMASELKRLVVRGWDSVTCFPLDLSPMLESLEISNCPKLESLSAASQAQPLQRCTYLRLSRCPNLRRLPECMASLFPSLMTLHIGDCPESTVVDLLRIFPNLSELELESCCEELESFPPENMLLPPTLTSLHIWHFPNLKSFDNTTFQFSTCLRELMIAYCPKLQFLPEVWLPSTYTRLYIYDCPKLQSIPCSLRLVDISGCPLVQLGQDWPLSPKRIW